MVAPVAATGEIEAVYRQDGDRLWRALYAFAGDEEVASDAVAEAFAQALRRGSAIRDVRSWVWRSFKRGGPWSGPPRFRSQNLVRRAGQALARPRAAPWMRSSAKWGDTSRQ